MSPPHPDAKVRIENLVPLVHCFVAMAYCAVLRTALSWPWLSTGGGLFGDPVPVEPPILGGDFNFAATHMQTLLATSLTPMDFTTAAAGTYTFQADSVKTEIDYYVMPIAMALKAEGVEVHREVEIRSHSPVRIRWRNCHKHHVVPVVPTYRKGQAAGMMEPFRLPPKGGHSCWPPANTHGSSTTQA